MCFSQGFHSFLCSFVVPDPILFPGNITSSFFQLKSPHEKYKDMLFGERDRPGRSFERLARNIRTSVCSPVPQESVSIREIRV
jgi:hypothetical protein